MPPIRENSAASRPGIRWPAPAARSAGGLRLLSRRKLKGIVGIALWDVNGGLKLYAEVVWSRRLGFRRHEIGMRFVDVTPQLAADLTTLATDNTVRREYLREPAPPGNSG